MLINIGVGTHASVFKCKNTQHMNWLVILVGTHASMFHCEKVTTPQCAPIHECCADTN